MGDSQLESTIDKAWEDRESITSATSGEIRDAVEAALESMDSGKERVASPLGDHRVTHPPPRPRRSSRRPT